ncbi:alpha/beta hydrolase [Dactylosporangium sp. NPDC005555]|uniref:alpha/beta fold hydrolase n=1 Tax=Dactylosporangium sp. NPDC005555 TaxID=3154889 RepID=UPI0033A2A20C
MMSRITVSTRRLTVGGVSTPLREAGPAGDREAVVFLHGNPGSGADWDGLLTRVGGFARAIAWDAPGFGQADKPRDFPHTVDGHAAYVAGALDTLGVERAHLVMHDFGGAWGLAWAVARPERFASAVLVDTGALIGYRWHRLARVWQTPVVGELFMAATTRRAFRAILGIGDPSGLPRDFLDRMFDDFDRDTRRAVLRLYRSARDIEGFSRRTSASLRPLRRPALVVWGAHDPYLPVTHARRQDVAFPDPEAHVFDHSGHWPFIDAPDRCATLVTNFLQRNIAR